MIRSRIISRSRRTPCLPDVAQTRKGILFDIEMFAEHTPSLPPFIILGSHLPEELMPDSYNGVPVPRDGARIEYQNGKIRVPDNPILPFIEGDGTGRDIWKVPSAYSMAPCKRLTTASAAFSGMRSLREKKPKPSSMTGFRRILSTLFANFVSQLKARSQLPSAAVFVL